MLIWVEVASSGGSAKLSHPQIFFIPVSINTAQYRYCENKFLFFLILALKLTFFSAADFIWMHQNGYFSAR
jgi:hypothetical protein